jgi:nucleoside-diphosphate-sugar epimerase
MSNDRIWVIGGRGRLGTAIVIELTAAGHEVPDPTALGSRPRLSSGSMTNAQSVEQAVAEVAGLS